MTIKFVSYGEKYGSALRTDSIVRVVLIEEEIEADKAANTVTLC